jgi:hypothetical protein
MGRSLKAGPQKRFASWVIVAAIAFGWSFPATALDPAADAYAREIANAVALASASTFGSGAAVRERTAQDFTVSLVFAQRSFRPQDPRCFSSLRRMFEEQVQALSELIPAPFRIGEQDAPRTVTLVVGHVVGQGADLSDIPLDVWRERARSRATFPVHGRSDDLGTPHEAYLNVLSGLYEGASGRLVYGQALISWGSTYLTAFLNLEDAKCQLNFVQQIAYLYTLDVRERLRDELNRVHIDWSNRATGAIQDASRHPFISRDVGYLITATVFCLQALNKSAASDDVVGCSSRLAKLMLA